MIHVVDYGAGNIGSVLNMIKKTGGKGFATDDVNELRLAKKIVLPGVGSFDNAITKLTNLGLVEILKEKANSDCHLLGICLGMQLLADSSEEGHLPGLGIIPGSVKKFKFEGSNRNLKIPHMGWNRVLTKKRNPVVDHLEVTNRFYFVHSYYFECLNEEDELLATTYGHSFSSGVARGNVVGLQFHPEKSHRFGMSIFEHFARL